MSTSRIAPIYASVRWPVAENEFAQTSTICSCIIYEDVDSPFVVDDSFDNCLHVIITGNIQRELLDLRAGEAIHGIYLTRGGVYNASPLCILFTTVDTLVKPPVLRVIPNLTHRAKPMPPFEHPVTRTTFLESVIEEEEWR